MVCLDTKIFWSIQENVLKFFIRIIRKGRSNSIYISFRNSVLIVEYSLQRKGKLSVVSVSRPHLHIWSTVSLKLWCGWWLNLLKHLKWVYPFSVMGWVSYSQQVLQLMMSLIALYNSIKTIRLVFQRLFLLKGQFSSEQYMMLLHPSSSYHFLGLLMIHSK